MIVRISNGSFAAENAAEVEQTLQHQFKASVYPVIRRLPGLIAYYAGIDRATGYMTNTSLWASVEAADQMRTLPEMLAARAQFEAIGVEFEAITNHEVLWDVAP